MTWIDKYIRPCWKAVVGFVAPAAGTLIAAVQDGSAGGSAIVQSEWVTALCVAVATAAGVWTVGNKGEFGKGVVEPAPAAPAEPVEGADL